MEKKLTDYTICKSYLRKALGLMFSKKRNLIFTFDKEKLVSLHMLFVFFPIWAVYLDNNRIVLEIKKLYPFISFYFPKHKAKYVLELIEAPEMKVGDKVTWNSGNIS